MQNDFINIAEMSKTFQNWKHKVIENSKFDGTTRDEQIVWQLNIQLAIAQQLAVISGHLSKIVDAIERSENKGK